MDGYAERFASRLNLPLALSLALLLVLGARTASAYDSEMARALEARGFEPVAERDGVEVYRHASSDLIRLVAFGRIPAPPEEVREALLSYERQLGAIERLTEVEVLEEGSDWLLVYQRLNIPVISDRDFTLLVRWGREGNDIWIDYRTANNRGPARRDGVVRLPVHKGRWQLKPLDEGRATLLQFYVTIDMGGMLPRSLAKAGAGRDVPDLFTSICRLVVGPESEESCH